jgi:hypothetical protein
MEVIFLPKRRFVYGLHGAIFQKMATHIIAAVTISNPMNLFAVA